MTFSCIKIKRKFKMKFNMTNYSVEAPNPAEEEEQENADVFKEDLKDSSRSYALSKSSENSTSNSSESSCILDTSNSGQTSSSPNVTTNESFTDDNKSKIEAQASKVSLNKIRKEVCKVKNNQKQKINKQEKAKNTELKFLSSSRTFQNASLPPAPPPPPPYVPSLQSMPSLPNSSMSASFGAIDSNTTNSAHCFITHLISSSHNVLIAPTAIPITKSSVSHSSSSGKISDISHNKQNNLVTRLISNRMEKLKLISKNRASLDPILLQNPAKGPAPFIKSPQQPKLYDRINLKSKLKEHLYSPLHFENEKLATHNQGQRLKALNYPRDDFVRDKKEFGERIAGSNKKLQRTDMVRLKQLYFKSNATTASATYDECNYAKSINTINSGDETDNQKTNDENEYGDGEYCSKNCNCNVSEDEYYDYEGEENNRYGEEEHNYNEYNYNGNENENFENEYDDVDYETNEEHETPSKTELTDTEINDIVLNGLEEVLEATSELGKKSDRCEIALLNELIDKELLKSPSKNETENEYDTSHFMSPQKSIVNDVEGYIRLTEDEINQILNEPSKFEQILNLSQGEEVLENSITCTSF